MVQHFCPYNPGRPIEQSELFINRKETLAEILTGLEELPPKSFAVIGGRRTGKTSVLLHIEREFSQYNDPVFCVPVYYNLQQLPKDPQAEYFYSRLFDNLQSKISELDKAEKILKVFDWRRKKEFDDSLWLDTFENILSNVFDRESQARLILLLDEIEQILDADWVLEFFGNLNFLVSRYQLALVLSVFSWPTFQRFAFDGAAIDFTIIPMEPFDFSSTETLIGLSKSKLTISKELTEKIYEQTGGHPYLLQAILQRIWHSAPDSGKVTLDHVLSAIKWFEQRKSSFEYWYRYEFNAMDQWVCRALTGQGPQTIEQLLSQNRDRDALTASLEKLRQTCLIRGTSEPVKYEISSQMFRNWLFRHTTV